MSIFTGTTGDDSITGGSAGDDFHMEQGGQDTVAGGDGADVFYFGATYDGLDRVDGGSGEDYLVLDGDYSAGLVFTATSLANVEHLLLTQGHSYDLSGLTDANVVQPFNLVLKVDASDLTAGDHVSLDARHFVRATLNLVAGAGDDTIIGGLGNDTIDGGDGDNQIRGGKGTNDLTVGDGDNTMSGGKSQDAFHLGAGANVVKAGEGDDFVYQAAFNPGDRLDGSEGTDRLEITAPAFQSVTMDGHNLKSFEIIDVTGAISITAGKGLVADGASLQVIQQSDTGSLAFDGSAIKHGAIFLDGAQGDDVLIGGAGNDTLFAGGDGDDRLEGGKGSDNYWGSLSTTYVYRSVQDSTATAPDEIGNLFDSCVIDLRRIDADTTQTGNQAFQLVAQLDGHAGQLALQYDSIREVTNLLADVDGDGQADLVVVLDGDHSGFTHFAL